MSESQPAATIREMHARIEVLETALRTIAEKSKHAAAFAREAGEIMFSDHALGARKCALDALGPSKAGGNT